MSTSVPTSLRLPARTMDQLADLSRWLGLDRPALVILAIQRLHDDEAPAHAIEWLSTGTTTCPACKSKEAYDYRLSGQEEGRRIECGDCEQVIIKISAGFGL